MRRLMLTLFFIAGCGDSEPCDPGQKLLWAMSCVPDVPPATGGSSTGGSSTGGSTSSGAGGEGGGDNTMGGGAN
jgi:hypothetical protein